MGLADTIDINSHSPSEDDEVSDDDLMEREEGGPWFNMGMTMEGKRESRRLWRISVIIKLIRRRIGYHYLSKCIQAM